MTFKKRRRSEIYSGIAGVISLFIMTLVILALIKYPHPRITNNPADYLALHITIREKSKITKGWKAGRTLHIYSNEYPDLDFLASGIIYHATEAERVLHRLEPKDIVVLYVFKPDYDIAVRKKAFLERIVHGNKVSMYGIVKNGRNFVDFEAIYKEHTKPINKTFNTLMNIFFLLFYCGLFVTTVHSFFFTKAAKRNRASRKRKRAIVS